MTDEHLQLHVRLECERGEQALSEAEKLIGLQLHYGGVSRAYYAVFHHARALALAAGVEPKSHAGVAHLLNLHYVRTGELPADTSRMFAELQKYRESSDYDAAFVITPEHAARVLDDARTFVNIARAWLTKRGLLVA